MFTEYAGVRTIYFRGTVFEYDGFTLTFEQGTVVLSNKLGQIRAIGRGGRSSTDFVHDGTRGVRDAHSALFGLLYHRTEDRRWGLAGTIPVVASRYHANHHAKRSFLLPPLSDILRGMGELNILFVEPFYGGSHRAFADGLKRHSRHRISLFSLPPRFWKWRMRGAALEVARHFSDPRQFDMVCAASMLSLADLRALWGAECPPLIAYYHENQLNYPLSPGESRDFHYGFTDITTGLAAERMVFNSYFHQRTFFEGLPGFINHMPDTRPLWVIEELRAKSTVLYPGIDEIPRVKTGGGDIPTADEELATGGDIPPGGDPAIGNTLDRGGIAHPPLIIWNHRWEHDKNPESFFNTLFELSDRGFQFRLAVAGEQFSRSPEIFDLARKKLGDKIEHFGYLENRRAYFDLLRRGDIVISTAFQENFGLSIVEAIAAGCFPLLPERLSYPELIPETYHSLCLYRNDGELKKRLAELLTGAVAVPGGPQGPQGPQGTDGSLKPAAPLAPPGLAEAMSVYHWPKLIPGYNALFQEVVRIP